MNKFYEHLALIVGGSSGMGKETAKRLIHRSVEPILLSHNADRLEKARYELGVYGPVQTVDVDLYDEEKVDNFINHYRNLSTHSSFICITCF